MAIGRGLLEEALHALTTGERVIRELVHDLEREGWTLSGELKGLPGELATIAAGLERALLAGVHVTVGPIRQTRSFMSLTLQDNQQVPLTATVTDERGNAASPDAGSTPTWNSSDPSIVGLALAADGLSATAIAAGPEGTATVTVSLTANGEALTGSLDIEVIASAATTVVVTPGTPEVSPNAAPAPAAPAAPSAPEAPPAPAPAPAPTATIVRDGAGLPLYQFAGTGAVDSSVWVQSTLTASDGSALYTFSGDVAGGDPAGASPEWVPYTGTLGGAAAPAGT